MFHCSSVADIPEADLIKQLLADPSWRSRIIGQRGIPKDAAYLRSVPLADVPGNFKGDIDILVCSPNEPDFATAIEVKRVKVGMNALRTGKPNKLLELEEGVRQANVHACIGFAQVYLYVFVVVDSREKTLGQKTWGTLSPELRQLITDAISVTGLHDRVGLFHHRFIQPVDDRPLGVGAYSGDLVRLAQTAAQPSELTKWVAQVTGCSAAGGSIYAGILL